MSREGFGFRGGMLAAANPIEELRPVLPDNSSSRPTPMVEGVGWVVVAGLGVALLLFLWAYLRRPGRKTLVSRAGLTVHAPEGDPVAEKRRRRRRKLKREPLPRNPTLAETGGLPPPKDSPGVGG